MNDCADELCVLTELDEDILSDTARDDVMCGVITPRMGVVRIVDVDSDTSKIESCWTLEKMTMVTGLRTMLDEPTCRDSHVRAINCKPGLGTLQNYRDGNGKPWACYKS
ncbi:LOW QUALITY PROTEIN: hypothetical protein YC2023_065386 [Brassica napus]